MFFTNMMTAAQQVLVLFLIVTVGFAADRLHIFSQKTAKASNDLLFYIITPTVIIQSFLSMDFSVERAGSLGLSFACMACTLLVGIVLAIPFFKKNKNSIIYKYAVSYGNMGYMALPLCQAILGNEGVFYCSAGVVAFNILCFTHGVWLMNKDKNGNKFELKKLILNPGVISVLIGLPLFVLGVKPPEFINSAIGHISNLNTPVAMIFFGTYMANTDLKNMFKVKENYLVAFLKLIVLPLVMFGLFKLFGISDAMLTACIISASVPSANNTAMFAAKYGKDTGVASQVVSFDSVLSILTIPIMIALSKI